MEEKKCADTIHAVSIRNESVPRLSRGACIGTKRNKNWRTFRVDVGFCCQNGTVEHRYRSSREFGFPVSWSRAVHCNHVGIGTDYRAFLSSVIIKRFVGLNLHSIPSCDGLSFNALLDCVYRKHTSWRGTFLTAQSPDGSLLGRLLPSDCPCRYCLHSRVGLLDKESFRVGIAWMAVSASLPILSRRI